LFRQLVASLLDDMSTNLILHEYQAPDLTSLLHEVTRIQPDMIILEDSIPFAGSSMLHHLLVAKPNLPIIVVSGESNEMHIVRKETTLLISSNDLINAINLVSQQSETTTSRQGESLNL